MNKCQTNTSRSITPVSVATELHISGCCGLGMLRNDLHERLHKTTPKGRYLCIRVFVLRSRFKRFQENTDSQSTGCIHRVNSSTMKVQGSYYERIQYGIFDTEPLFQDNLPAKREKLITDGENWRVVSNAKAIRLRRHIGSLGHA